ncbi:hypothetical protein [Aliiglaciecola lipolytica]|uniref:hypothetical protein n=1 Tax=Aliiglaciecola lipolytica TaxID=477689 RepID=UPI001C086911|nr:hypothetical protein [Aliiglaciecola lipolytica]MBU2878011.1 hypothetical protein [Aliiglaciecola lipolytica]
MSKHFIVTSHGWSASNWVAHSLNLNEKILCTHSARNALANDAQIHNRDNFIKNLSNFHEGYLNRQESSLDGFYQYIESLGNSDYYGSVHLLRLRDIPILYRKYGPPSRNFKIANLVRNPVDLVWSGYGQLQDLFLFDINELYWTLDKIISEGKNFTYSLIEKYQINIGEYKYLAFIGACAILSSIKKDCDAYELIDRNKTNIDFIGTFTMESITQERESFKQMLSKLTDNSALTSVDYLDKVFGEGEINRHKKDSKKITSRERYNSFEPWQKDTFNYFFKKFDLRSKYESFGYDFSYIEV